MGLPNRVSALTTCRHEICAALGYLSQVGWRNLKKKRKKERKIEQHHFSKKEHIESILHSFFCQSPQIYKKVDNQLSGFMSVKELLLKILLIYKAWTGSGPKYISDLLRYEPSRPPKTKQYSFLSTTYLQRSETLSSFKLKLNILAIALDYGLKV